MITVYTESQGKLLSLDSDLSNLQQVVWIDLLRPTAEEEAQVEAALRIDIPTREEMQEIEVSSRLYLEEEAAFMTATLPANTDSPEPELAPVTFVLTGRCLVTVRYHEPRAFQAMPARASRVSIGCNDGEHVLIALLEVQVDRLADVLERYSGEIAQISGEVFARSGPDTSRSSNYRGVLETIGREGDLTSNIRETLISVERMLGFLSHVVRQGHHEKDLNARVRTLSRDLQSLLDHSAFMTQKITFLLDAVLGLINIEQNAIIKIFSVAAVVFLPPTLVASVYGMNFDVMPELRWLLGYPFALGLMVASAVLPLLYFKHRRWL